MPDCIQCERSFGSSQAIKQHYRDSPAHKKESPLDRFFRSFAEFDYDSSQSPSDEMLRLQKCYGWNRDNADGQTAWDEYRKALVQEFEVWYGRNDNDLNAWRSLCRAVRIDPIPSTRDACQEVIRGRYVNMVDLVDYQRSGQKQVEIFDSLESLRDYTNTTRRYFPKDSLESGALLKHLLREIFTKR